MLGQTLSLSLSRELFREKDSDILAEGIFILKLHV